MRIFDSGSFYLRQIMRNSPALFIFFSLALSLLAIAAAVYFKTQGTVEANRILLSRDIPALVVPASLQSAGLALPAFHAVPLVNAIQRSAERSGTAVDEVTFALDDANIRPYIRYQANLTLSGHYPAMRAFVEDMQTTLRYVSLDSIQCSRDDIGAKDVGCKVTLSAFYRRQARD